MSFLAPFYIAGLAAIALPLIFHLIRRTPRGQTPFSSLMFLTPSPPRITRRSRLDQLLLLLLRALALTLLALAFARPFFREAAQLGLDSQVSRRIAILVDTSASMRRADLWRQSQDRVKTLLADARPGDRIALFAFDEDVATLVDFADPPQIEPRRRASLIERRLAESAPTWNAGDLGSALAIVAERLDALDHGRTDEAELAGRIVLVSDLQQGSRLETLQGYEWPARVELEIHPVAPKDSTNAGIQLVGSGWHEAADMQKSESDEAPAAMDSTAGHSYRVQIANAADSAAEQFEVVWIDAEGATVAGPLKTYVPPGQSRTLRVPEPAQTGALRLVLRGDAHDFDNVLHVAPRVREEVRVVYLGNDSADDPQGARYYIERAFPESPHRSIDVVAPAAQEPLAPPGELLPRLVIIAGSLEADRAAELLQYLERGGRALLAATGAPSPALSQLLNEPALAVSESDAGDYALLGTIDFSHPLLAPFADPRYSDFTKILFWKHRRIAWERPVSDSEPEDLRVLARFDNQDPALIEREIGRGRLYVLATTWRPDDSQLARSSKFVPLLWGMLGEATSSETAATYVNQPLRLPAALDDAATMQKPDGTTALIPAGAAEFDETDQPGVYAIGEHRFVVQLDPAESNTAPGSPEELEQFGVRLTGAAQREAEDERQRHLRDVELESRQKIWRWLLAAALAVLVCEIWLAGRQTRKA
jgi:hypothetical protein